MIKILITITIVMLTTLFAENNITATSDMAEELKLNVLNGTTNTDKTMFKSRDSEAFLKQSQKKAKRKNPKRIINIQAFKDAIIYNNVVKHYKDTNVPTVQKKVNFYGQADTIVKNNLKLKNDMLKQSKKSVPTTRFLQANCMVHQNILVSLKDFMKLTCQVEDSNDIIEVFGSYIADNKNYSLLGKIDYIKKDGRIYKADENSFMTNALETSYNLATVVNTREVEKINIILTKNMTKESANEGKAILQDLKNANQQQSVAYDQNGNAITATTNTKPTSSDIAERVFYSLVIGALNGISEITNQMQDKLPYLYKIEKGSILKANIFIVDGKDSNSNNIQKQNNKKGGARK